MQPTGKWLAEHFHRAGGLPAVTSELLAHGIPPHPSALTVTGHSVCRNVANKKSSNDQVIMPYHAPLVSKAGFLNLKGTLFGTAIMKTCGISDEFRGRYLSNPADQEAFEGPVCIFDGPEQCHAEIDSRANITDRTILVVRGAGPLGFPGSAEVVNMQPPARLVRESITELPCIGDGRQSGTSGSPSILNASPEAAAGGGLALLRDGDMVRMDLGRRRADILVSAEELSRRRVALESAGGFPIPKRQTPWQEIFREKTGQLDGGMVMESALKYQRITQEGEGVPRDNH
jgi:dihydroxy-acid dehydratase